MFPRCLLWPGLRQNLPHSIRSLLNWMGSQSYEPRHMSPFMGQMMPRDITEAQRGGNLADLQIPRFTWFSVIQSALIFSFLIFKEANLCSVLGCFICLFFPSLFLPLGLEPRSSKWPRRLLHTLQKTVLKYQGLTYYPVLGHCNCWFLSPKSCLPLLCLRDSKKAKGREWN